jgi:hypothetical protein
MLQLLVTANVDLSSPILVILMMEAIYSSETLVPKIATRRNIPEDYKNVFTSSAIVCPVETSVVSS